MPQIVCGRSDVEKSLVPAGIPTAKQPSQQINAKSGMLRVVKFVSSKSGIQCITAPWRFKNTCARAPVYLSSPVTCYWVRTRTCSCGACYVAGRA